MIVLVLFAPHLFTLLVAIVGPPLFCLAFSFATSLLPGANLVGKALVTVGRVQLGTENGELASSWTNID